MKKGFTLIELLAVIVILAIIALIATPLVIKVIDGAKKGAFKDSAYGIVKAGEIGYTQDVLDGINEEVTFTYTDGIESSSVSGKTLNYKGAKPTNGEIKINDEGKVSMAIHDGLYCAEKSYNDSQITVTEKTVEECQRPIISIDTSGASAPELTTGMIPVKWDGTNWVKADINNEKGTNQWYDYDSKIWANAVTVTNTNRTTYQNAAAGTIMPLSDINTMWVWIPRYSYYITTSGTTTPSEIQIKFESKTDSKSTGDAVNTYLTHPAFTFGATEVNGMWVGKFETTGTIGTPTVLPNTLSLRSQTIKAIYDASRAMENNVTYGTSTDGNIHIAKNSEWGAVAYLSHSKYGKNSEIWKNNSSTYTTGCVGDSVSESSYSGCQNQYDTPTGGNASTTGNIYGIYDMSGAASEYTMSNYNNVVGNSDFSSVSTIPDEYIDRYTTDVATTACDGGICYGSALSETSGWYSDYASFVYDFLPWPGRGGFYSNGADAGAFNYGKGSGAAAFNYSSRLVQMKP